MCCCMLLLVVLVWGLHCFRLGLHFRMFVLLPTVFPSALLLHSLLICPPLQCCFKLFRSLDGLLLSVDQAITDTKQHFSVS